MKYKSLLLDVDGTLVPVGPYNLPSERVIQSLKEASEHVSVSIVSGRSLDWLIELFSTLDLTHPSIINGGSQIIDPKTKEIIWERPLETGALEQILQMARRDQIPFIVNDDGIEYKNPTTTEFGKPLAIQLSYFDSKEKSDRYLEMIQKIPGLAAHKFFSWDKDKNYKMDIYITHEEATKEHAAKELARILGVDPSEMIGVGDSRNDLPLLNICGLKIAMGNADDKLKKVAHHIVPSVEDDGVAHVVERFILSG